MPYRDRFLNSKERALISDLEKQFPNLHFEVYSDAFLVLRPQPKLCLKYDLSWLKAGVDKLYRSEYTVKTMKSNPNMASSPQLKPTTLSGGFFMGKL